MKKFILKISRFLIIPGLIIFIIALTGFLIYRNAIIQETKTINSIITATGIESLEEVTINNRKNWIYIRSQDKTKPILLFIHGGPGISSMPFAKVKYQGELEKSFIVIHWDQRGSGKTFSLDIEKKDLTIGQYVEDATALSEYLLKRFKRKKLYLAGHSWGSVIGLLSANRKPELYFAYIGIGQIANMEESELISYNYCLVKAKENGDTFLVDKLLEIGSPPYKDLYLDTSIQKSILIYYGGGLYNKENYIIMYLKEFLDFYGYDFIDLSFSLPLGMYLTSDAVLQDLVNVNFKNLKKVQIPIYFCLGVEDYVVPAMPASDYLQSLKAPKKKVYWFNKSGHFPQIEEPLKFSETMNEILSETYSK